MYYTPTTDANYKLYLVTKMLVYDLILILLLHSSYNLLSSISKWPLNFGSDFIFDLLLFKNMPPTVTHSERIPLNISMLFPPRVRYTFLNQTKRQKQLIFLWIETVFVD